MASDDTTRLQCQHCDHEWSYTGEKEYPGMVTCPNCYYKVRLPE